MRLSGIAIATGLAGCQTTTGGDDDERDTTDRDTSEPRTTTVEENQEAEIEFVDAHNVTTLPIVRPDTIDDVARVELEITDPDGLQSVAVAYTDDYRAEPLQVADETGIEEGTGTDGHTIQLTGEFPRRVIAPSTGEFTVEVTDATGTTQTRTEPIRGLKASYRADRIRVPADGADPRKVGNYSTDRNWDNLTTNTQEIEGMQQEWLNEAAYNLLISQVMSGEDFETRGNVYPNYGDGNNRGFFDQDAVRNEDNFETLLRWYLPAIMDHDDENYGTAPSSRYARFGATMETLINQHHPDAEAKATGVTSLPAHGIFGVQDQNNEEFYLVDTTVSSPQFDQAVAKIGEGFITSEDGNRSELWDPYHDFEPGPAEVGTYEGKSRSSRVGLMGFVDKKVSNEQLDYDSFFITDEWMDDAYQVLRNGGSIQPIVEPIEEMIYESIMQEEENKIGIYGTLDDTRMAVDSTGEIYEAVEHDETTTQGVDEIESMLETAPAQ